MFIMQHIVPRNVFWHVTLYQRSERSAHFTDLYPSPSVGLCVCLCVSLLVCPESVLWKNG